MGMLLHRQGEARRKNTPPQHPPSSGEGKTQTQTSTNTPKGQNGGGGAKRPPSRPSKQ